MAASRFDWLALDIHTNSERRSRSCPRSRLAGRRRLGAPPRRSPRGALPASAVVKCIVLAPRKKGHCRYKVPLASTPFCLSTGANRSDQPTKFEALDLTIAPIVLDIANVVIVAFR